jgi:hypothetical protein
MTTSLDQEMAERLIMAVAWDAYVQAKLLPLYAQVSAMLDEAKDDHRYLQGLKHGIRMALSMPYEVAQKTGPLEGGWRRPANSTPGQQAEMAQMREDAMRAMPGPLHPPTSHLA